jgi:competence protein ComEA
MKGKGNEFDFEALIDRYRLWIGSVLLIAVIFSGGYLVWRENSRDDGNAQVSEEKIVSLEKKIQSSELKIQQLEQKIADISKNQIAEQAQTASDAGQVAGTSTSASATETISQQVAGKVNINTATATQLDTLPGIGPAYASRIIEYRNANGGFKDISEIKNIKGIGEKTFEKLKDLITI